VWALEDLTFKGTVPGEYDGFRIEERFQLLESLWGKVGDGSIDFFEIWFDSGVGFTTTAFLNDLFFQGADVGKVLLKCFIGDESNRLIAIKGENISHR